MKARLIAEIGTRAWFRRYVLGNDEKCAVNPAGFHDAITLLGVSDRLRDWGLGGSPDDHAEFSFPTHCDHCDGDMVRLGSHIQIYRRRRYDTESGNPELGDLFWADWYHPSSGAFDCLHGWSNCTGPHLVAVLPNGRQWDIDSRASNCTKREDPTHRCWIREGEPPNITVTKNGRSCDAGGGSVVCGDWHGYLRGGIFEKA